MTESPRRSRDTLDLIGDLQAKAARRRRRIMISLAAVGVVLLALATTLTVLATSGSGRASVGASTTSSAVPSHSTTTEAPMETTYDLGDGPTVDPYPDTTTPGLFSESTQPEATPLLPAGPSTYVVVIDPGHQAQADSSLEPIGPGSSKMKARVSSGTRSVNTGSPESELVLAVGLQLRDELEAHGIRVVMTRTTQDVSISNSERAQIANSAGADLFVRIHADGASDPSINGILMLYPANIEGWTDDIAAESKEAARLALDHLVLATGAHDRGMIARSDITGFNWSDVPVILPEIGLMTNPTEDALLATADYQDKIVQGLVQAILSFLEVS